MISERGKTTTSSLIITHATKGESFRTEYKMSEGTNETYKEKKTFTSVALMNVLFLSYKIYLSSFKIST